VPTWSVHSSHTNDKNLRCLPLVLSIRWSFKFKKLIEDIIEPRHDKTNIIRIHAVPLQTLLQVEKLIANSMDPDQTARMRRLVWIHAGRKPIMLVFS
jgi:hypothetical protein